jgi:aspartyl-tRNA(Asn)/glutamyl-tRNA(Gln) amidotransferase subunit C
MVTAPGLALVVGISLERPLGRHVSGVARDDGGIEWDVGRKRRLGPIVPAVLSLASSAKTSVACFETIASRSPQHQARRRALLAPRPRCYSQRVSADPRNPMSVDSATVRRIAHLARIKVSEREVPHLQNELNAILAFVEELGSVDVEGVEPMTSVTPMPMKKRADIVTDGSIPDKIVANAPASDDHFFVVPKVVE